MSRPSTLFGDYINRPQKPDAVGTVLSVSPFGTVDVQLASGEVIRRIDLAGAAAAGDEIRLRYDNGRYVAQGSRAGGDRAGGAYLVGSTGGGGTTGAPSPHDLLGVHHNLPTLTANLFLASPVASSGVPAFRAIGATDLPAMTVTAGDGLTGGGDIRGNPTLNAVVANTGAVGLTVEDDAIRLTSSSNPGAAAKVLATDAAGKLQLVQIGLGVAPAYALHVLDTNVQARFAYDNTHYADVFVDSGGNLKLSPVGMLIISAGGEAVVPNINYSGALGLPNRKWLTLDVAELHAEILVAREKVVTIGGRFMVAAGGVLIGDCPATA